MTASVISFATARRLRSLPPPRLNLRLGDEVVRKFDGLPGTIVGIMPTPIGDRPRGYHMLTEFGIVVVTEASVERVG